jgi:hypothetical protein
MSMKQFIYPITAIFLFQTTFSTMAFAENQAAAKTAATGKEAPVVPAVPQADQIGEDAITRRNCPRNQ